MLHLSQTLRSSDVPQRVETSILAGAGLGVLALLLYAFQQHCQSSLTYFLYYNVPIAAPFAAFLIERLYSIRETRSDDLARSPASGVAHDGTMSAFAPSFHFGARVLLDGTVVIMSLARAVLPMSYGYSGHAFFLAFATFTARSAALRILSLLVLLEVLAIKLFLWHDFQTPSGSIVLATLVTAIYRKLRRPVTQPPSNPSQGPYRTHTGEQTSPSDWPVLLALLIAVSGGTWVAVEYWQSAFFPHGG